VLVPVLAPELVLAPGLVLALELVLALALGLVLALGQEHSRQQSRCSPVQQSPELKVFFSLLTHPFFKISSHLYSLHRSLIITPPPLIDFLAVAFKS